MSKTARIEPEPIPTPPATLQRNAVSPKLPDSTQFTDHLGGFAAILKLRDTHPFAPKGAFARWLHEFSEEGNGGTSPPPMA